MLSWAEQEEKEIEELEAKAFEYHKELMRQHGFSEDEIARHMTDETTICESVLEGLFQDQEQWIAWFLVTGMRSTYQHDLDSRSVDEDSKRRDRDMYLWHLKEYVRIWIEKKED